MDFPQSKGSFIGLEEAFRILTSKRNKLALKFSPKKVKPDPAGALPDKGWTN